MYKTFAYYAGIMFIAYYAQNWLKPIFKIELAAIYLATVHIYTVSHSQK